MKRETKFRAWIGDKCYSDVVPLFNTNEIILNNPLAGNKLFKIDCFEQYTGLKDKNNKEVYEGDIYKNSWNGNQLIEFEITDSRETTGHGSTDRFVKAGFNLNYVNLIEIIGNIHENPELLK